MLSLINPIPSISFIRNPSRHAPAARSAPPPSHPTPSLTTIRSSSWNELHRRRSGLESLFCYDKPVPEEMIERPVGVSLERKDIGDTPPCEVCDTKGGVLCATCSGSGLYVDAILESQGIIVKVRCLGCGGTGNIMCPDCGGRGHL